MSLTDAVARFRAVDEATTTASIGRYLTGLAVGKRPKPCKKKGYDPKCRDKEWERPTLRGSISLLRRQPI